MKVLFVTNAHGADYMCDVTFHGLRSLLGPDCVDSTRMDFMYENGKDYYFHSLYKLLPDIEVDRDDIPAKIHSYFFDAIVFGSVHRCTDYYDLARALYPRNKLAFIDGEDDANITGHLGHGWYFKRELQTDHPDLLPIQFGIPEEKIRPIDLSRKTRLMAHCDPRDRSTMVYYDSESRYYDQYSDAYFGYTMKKGGWDCMRHHEILAAGCMPYFADFDNCPKLTLSKFDRSLFKEARDMADNWGIEDEEYWYRLAVDVRESLKSTKQIAKYVLEHLQ